MSTASTTPFWGRRWELRVLTAPEDGSQLVWTIGQDAWLPESLRLTFDINLHVFEELWWGDICIYNLNKQTMMTMLYQGYQVILSAGYQDGSNYGVIFEGRIFQAIWEKVEGTDYKLTLHCMVGMGALINNMVSYTALAGTNMHDALQGMMATARNPINVTNLDSATLGMKILPRGEVFYGNPKDFLSETADSFGFQFWHGPDGINLGDMSPKSKQPSVIYSSIPDTSNSDDRQDGVRYTIIGTPQQTPEGVNMRVLLDSSLQVKLPAMLFKIDNTVIRQMLLQVGTMPPLMTTDGVYAVARLRHVGDTRGNEWYTDVTGMVSAGLLLAALAWEKSLRGE